MNTQVGSATDGTREERAYYCQNWRGDVVTMLKSTGGTNCSDIETVRYSSYGVPFGITPGDVDGDGDVDTDDNTNWPGSYEVRCDYDLDGDMDLNDENVTIANVGRSLGRGVLSHSSVANRRGYCGYEHDGVIDTLAHVRHRVLLTELGRWSRRDPLGYVDGMSVYQYVGTMPVVHVDPSGQRRWEDPLLPDQFGTPTRPRYPNMAPHNDEPGSGPDWHWSCVGNILACEAMTAVCILSVPGGVAACASVCSGTFGFGCFACVVTAAGTSTTFCIQPGTCWQAAADSGCF